MPNSTVHVDYDLVANGDHITIGDATFTGSSAYPDAIGWLTARAANTGTAVVVRSYDAGTGADTLFSIDGAGTIEAVAGTVSDSAAGSPWEAQPVGPAVSPAPRAEDVDSDTAGAPFLTPAPVAPPTPTSPAALEAEAVPSTRREARQSFLTREGWVCGSHRRPRSAQNATGRAW
jgi:hypothetical protein